MIPGFIHFKHNRFKTDIGALAPGRMYPFYSDKQWDLYELFIYLLGLSGKSKVWLSTFSISEASVRGFASAIRDELVSEFNCIFDYTMKKNKLELLFFAHNVVTNIYVLPNHSKLILIESEKWKMTVIGSANMTPNPRKEVGVIFTIPEIFDHYMQFFNECIEQGTKIEF